MYVKIRFQILSCCTVKHNIFIMYLCCVWKDNNKLQTFKLQTFSYDSCCVFMDSLQIAIIFWKIKMFQALMFSQSFKPRFMTSHTTGSSVPRLGSHSAQMYWYNQDKHPARSTPVERFFSNTVFDFVSNLAEPVMQTICHELKQRIMHVRFGL